MKKTIWLILIVQSIMPFHLKYISDPKALCLDGSPSSFYKAEGYGTGAKKYILHFQGELRIGGQTYDQLVESAYTRQTQDLYEIKDRLRKFKEFELTNVIFQMVWENQKWK